MASNPSPSAPTPDTLITLKVNFNGSNRRFKLPLRDLTPDVLPRQLKQLLAIPQTSEVSFERYSDSAAAFVVLDVKNTAVYKQLYRAAKAKLKLRLRVDVKDKEPEPVLAKSATPKPANVEDEEQAPSTKHVESPKVASSVPAPDAARGSTEKVAHSTRLRDTLTMLQKEESKSQEPRATRLSMQRQGQFAPDPHLRTLPAPYCSSPKAPAKTSAVAPSPPKAQYLFPAVAPSDAKFCVYCNNCNVAIPDFHYHCDTCEKGDFDLCLDCNANGVTCSGEHWLIKRTVKNGKYIYSTTETFKPKKQFSDSKATLVAPVVEEEKVPVDTRTCNCCMVSLPEKDFITCEDCEDYDLCLKCHVELKHGHNPRHSLTPVDSSINHGAIATALCRPGRNTSHRAICDSCDKYIYGVRHKCLDCPDWDYCDSCITTARFDHPGHRFVPLYEPLNTSSISPQSAHVRHVGIFCDGPLCNSEASVYITGDRYKCCVCHDTDFCASCEASPLNSHNKTHPLIKFKTPVRNVSVTTLSDHPNGQALPPMGDRRPECQTNSKATETVQAQSTNAATQVQTVAEVKPTEVKVEEPVKVEEVVKVEQSVEKVVKVEQPVEKVVKVEEPVEKAVETVEPFKLVEEPAILVEEPVNGKEVAEKPELVAHFMRDAISDGTIMIPNSVFEQTWYLRNNGKTAWPAGCSVRFVGGDNMCAIDPEHPASVHELVSAAESTICYTEVAPMQEHGFTVLMRTPSRPGNFISYWRLTSPTGEKFGHRLWCDITVREPAPVVKEEPVVKTEEKAELASIQKADFSTAQKQFDAAIARARAKIAAKIQADTEAAEAKIAEAEANTEAASTKAEGSQMIFPKLVKESPVSSVHEEIQREVVQQEEVQQASEVPATEEIFDDDFEEFNEGQEYDGSEDGFMTDEEYDILDADDEEYLAEQQAASKK